MAEPVIVVPEDGTLVILSRVRNHTTGAMALAADITNNSVKVVNEADLTDIPFSNAALTGAIIDTPKTDRGWPDAEGYNYEHVLPETAVPTPDKTLEYSSYLTAVGGRKYWGPRVRLSVEDVKGSA